MLTAWESFRRFRRGRPFWAGLFAILGGVEILLLPLSPVADLVLLGVAGVSGALIGVLLVILGAFIWFSPPNRTLAGVLTCVISLASFVVSNLGGLIVGMVLGLIGGGLALAWTPDKAARPGRRWFKRRVPPPAAVLALLVGLLPALLWSGSGSAEALPLLPDPPGGSDSGSGSESDLPALPRLPMPQASDLPTPPMPDDSPLPPVLADLAGLVPAGLLAPLQPSVRPEPGVVVSGLVGDLRMDTLVVTNFRYQGIVDYPVAGGGRQKALRIVLDSTDIGNLRINQPGPDASVQVNQRKGAPHASTTRLILDCTRVRLTIAGLLTVEFTLDFPPPPLIVIPYLAATDVQIDYVRLATPTLIVPRADAVAAGPAGKRVGYTPGSAPAPNIRRPLTPVQVDQLARLSALLKRPELLRPYQQSRL